MTADAYRRWLVLALRLIGWAGLAVAGLGVLAVAAALIFAIVGASMADLANHDAFFVGGGFALAGLFGIACALVAAIPFLALAEVLDLLRRRDASDTNAR